MHCNRKDSTTPFGAGALVLAVVALLAASVPLAAGEGAPAVSEHLTATGLSWQPQIELSEARLRVVGPQGFLLTKQFASGEPIAVEPLIGLESRTAGEDVGPDHDSLEARPTLVEGGYQYELVLTDRDGRSQHHSGSFFVEAGALKKTMGSQNPPEQRPAEGPWLAPLSEESPQMNFDQFVGIVDTNNTNNTRLNLFNSGFPDMGMHLFQGTLRLRTGFGSATGTPHLTIVSSTGNVGIGTTTPARDLHLVRDSGNPQSSIMIENQHGDIFTMGTANFPQGRFTIFGPDGSPRFGIEPNSPTSALFVEVDGVGLGVPSGSILAGLHVRGNTFDSPTTMIVERTDGGVANIRFRSTGGGGPTQNWLFQNNPANLVFAIRDESGGASPFRIFGGSPENNFVVRGARWGLNVANPAHPIDTSTGARLSAGGVWQNASSRTLKDGIETLTVTEALETLLGLEPIKYTYKADPDERHVGFIAEDVPALVASADRLGLSSMDIVAVLTRVVQEQHGLVQDLRGAAQELQAVVEEQQSEINRLGSQQDELALLRARLAALEALLLEAGEARLASGSER